VAISHSFLRSHEPEARCFLAEADHSIPRISSRRVTEKLIRAVAFAFVQGHSHESSQEIHSRAAGNRFVHISAVERAGMRDFNEGQKISYDVVADKRTGKSSADNLKPA
jgi:cold shock CspA family protein